MGTKSLFRLLNDNVSIVPVVNPSRRNYTFTLQQNTNMLTQVHSLYHMLLRNQDHFFESFTVLPSIPTTLRITNEYNGGPQRIKRYRAPSP